MPKNNHDFKCCDFDIGVTVACCLIKRDLDFNETTWLN